MSAIYTPKGRAREYSPLALNLYKGCTHGCDYCYAPGTLRMTREEYHAAARPRAIIKQIEQEAAKLYGTDRQVLLSFIGDPYCPAEDQERLTRRALDILLAAHIPVAVLTKGGKRCLRDLDLFQAFGRHIKVGASLTFLGEKLSLEHEPGAAVPADRLEALAELHAAGVRTWASVEPVVIPEESLDVIQASLRYVDEYRLGHLLGAGDRAAYLEAALRATRGEGKIVYVKQMMREQAPGVALFPDEMDCDFGLAEPWGAPAEAVQVCRVSSRDVRSEDRRGRV